MADHLKAIAVRHRELVALPHSVCRTCQQVWPCDAADLQRLLQQAQEKLANWEPWMSALGRMLTEHRIARFPDDVLAWRANLQQTEELVRLGSEAVARLGGEVEVLKAERDAWADAATIQNDEIQACLTELEKAGWHGPASPGVEHLRERAEAAEALAHRRLVLLCNVQSHTTVSADIIRMIDEKAEAPVLAPAEAQARQEERE